jgi:hypothetical protein
MVSGWRGDANDTLPADTTNVFCSSAWRSMGGANACNQGRPTRQPLARAKRSAGNLVELKVI